MWGSILKLSVILAAFCAYPVKGIADVEDHAARFRSKLTFSHSNRLIHDKSDRAAQRDARLGESRIEGRSISRDRYDKAGYQIDDADPIHYQSLAGPGLLVDQSQKRRQYEADAYRRELITTEECPLILMFSNDYGGEAVKGQMDEVPEHCREGWQGWADAVTDQDESRLLASEEKQVIERAEDFDDTNMGKVKIDADGLAWLVEYLPPEEIEEPVTYVIVKPNGMKYTITEDTSRTKTVRTKPRFKKTLLPQYSRPEALEKWHKQVGRGIASETPEYEEAHW